MDSFETGREGRVVYFNPVPEYYFRHWLHQSITYASRAQQKGQLSPIYTVSAGVADGEIQSGQ